MMADSLPGSIVNISSIVGKYTNVGVASTRQVKPELQHCVNLQPNYQDVIISVNATLPGYFETQMVKAIPYKVQEKLIKMISLGRYGKTEEIAGVIMFLASTMSSYINGAAIDATGE